MRRRLPIAMALPATALVLGTMAMPAVAASIPTTPVPGPVSPGQPPASAPNGPQPLGHAVGDAAAAVGDLQVLPGLVDTASILPMPPGSPKQPLIEGGIGLSSAQVNSEAYLNYERSVAESSPVGGAVGGNAPSLPGALRQTALPDNPDPTTGGLDAPKNPLLNAGLLDGSVHARWSDELGPCVGTISDASTSVASLSVLNLGSATGLDKLGALGSALNPAALSDLGAKAQDAVKTKSSNGGVNPANVVGMLQPKVNSAPAKADDGGPSLLNVPNTISSRSTVKLVDIPGSENKAVKSVSTFQFADATLFKGTPFPIKIKVASQPTLTAISTGKKSTSSIKYKAPALEIDLPGGAPPIKIDARNPTANIPMSLPLPGAPADVAGKALKPLSGVPVFGDVAKKLQSASDDKGGNGFSLDLGVLKLGVGQLDQTGQVQHKGEDGAPFSGYQLGGSANMFDLQILPLPKTLKVPNGLPTPSSVARVSFGKQVARAYAPTNGVECGTTQPASTPANHTPKPQAKAKPPLAYTDAAYQTVPLFWTGTGLLLAGAVLVAALPGRRVRKAGTRK
jgi:hypothetical protein